MKNYKLPLLLALIAVLCLSISFAAITRANPSQILLSASAAATTTVTYMTPGAATTTPVFDTQSDLERSTDNAELLVWMNATNTTSAIDLYPQYSDGSPQINCATTPTLCNWYFAVDPPNYATTTVEADISKPAKYRWTFASTSPDLSAAAANASTTRAIGIKTPTRYVRVLIVVPVGAGNAAVWTEWAGKKQN